MTTEETFKPEESLAVISSMINTAKNKLADDGFYFIFWGWLIAFCAMANYILFQMNYSWGWMVWPILPPLGAIISAWYGYSQNKKTRVKTYVDTYLTYVWVGFLIAMILVIFFGYIHGIKATYFFLMILYGIATFTSGGILQFRPLIIGSFFAFACAVISVYVGDLDQFLCITVALITSYIIPGHMLRAKYKSQHV